PFPAPVSSITRHSRFAEARPTASASASCKAMLKAFMRSGRFRISVRTPSSSDSSKTGCDETSAPAVMALSLDIAVDRRVILTDQLVNNKDVAKRPDAVKGGQDGGLLCASRDLAEARDRGDRRAHVF